MTPPPPAPRRPEEADTRAFLQRPTTLQGYRWMTLPDGAVTVLRPDGTIGVIARRPTE